MKEFILNKSDILRLKLLYVEKENGLIQLHDECYVYIYGKLRPYIDKIDNYFDIQEQMYIQDTILIQNQSANV